MTEPLPLWKVFAPAAAVAALAVICAVRNVPFLRVVLLGVAVCCGYAMVQNPWDGSARAVDK